MSKPNASQPITDTRRRGIRRTAWAFGLVAIAAYASLFLMATLK